METNFQCTNIRQTNTINIYLETDFVISNNDDTNIRKTNAIQLHVETNISYANYKITYHFETHITHPNNG